MDTPANHRLEDIFAQAVALPEGDRAAWLDVVCAGQAELRSAVEALLRSHDAAGFMNGVPPRADIEREFARLKPEEAGERIGNYKLLEQIGEGGFGIVWVAEQEAPVRRRVALKIIKLGMDTKEVVARFEQERQALAIMDHPHIAKVHDAGVTQFGRPYFVMELVRGMRITDYCDEAKLVIADRLKLFNAVCHAVQHAHQKGIIHRDLKPSNILVTLDDGVPVPKVIDFGVAKATQSQRLTDLTVYTHFEQMIGTPLYMSPEQAEISGLDIDTRSDIYSLGVVLYELLTGQTPFDPEVLMRKGLDEIRRAIREQEPQKPSAALTTMAVELRTAIARQLQTDAKKLLSLIRGDLDWIVMKAMEKDRTRRYETANGFALDIQRYLACEPVTAAAPTLRYRFGKFARRHGVGLALGVMVTIILATATIVSLWQRQIALGATKEVENKKSEVDAKNIAYAQMLGEAARSDRLIAEEHLDADRAREGFAHLARACVYQPESARFAAEKAVAALNSWSYASPLSMFSGHLDRVQGAQLSPDGRRVVTVALHERFARVWDAQTGAVVARLEADDRNAWPDSWQQPVFSGDGSKIAAASRNTTWIWETATGRKLRAIWGHSDAVGCVEFSPDGNHIVTASRDGTARVWDISTGESRVTLTGHKAGLWSARYIPGGKHIVTASRDKTVRVWEAATGTNIATLEFPEGLEFVSGEPSPNGMFIVTRSGNLAHVWTTAGRKVSTLAGHTDSVNSARFGPVPSRFVVTSSSDKTARVWEFSSGRCIAVLSGHQDYVWSARFSPDGARVVTASKDKTAQVWEAATGRRLAMLAGHQDDLRDAQYDADGSRILTYSSDGSARLWQATPASLVTLLTGHSAGGGNAQFSSDSTRIVTASWDKTARLWDVKTGKHLSTLTGHAGRVSSAAFSADGTLIVTASEDKTARVWHLGTGKMTTLAGHEAWVTDAEFSPDGKRVVTVSADETARVWDVSNGKALFTVLGHRSGVRSAQYTPDGTGVITTSRDNFALVSDANTGKQTGSVRVKVVWLGRGGRVAISRDASRGITFCPYDILPPVWDVRSGEVLGKLAGHKGEVQNADFNASARRVVTASSDQTARVWELPEGKLAYSLRGHPGPVHSAVFSPNENHIVTTSGGDSSARLWTILPPNAGTPPEWFPDFLRFVAQMRLNSGGELETLKPDDWLALRERMRAIRRESAGQDTPYLQILRRWVPE